MWYHVRHRIIGAAMLVYAERRLPQVSPNKVLTLSLATACHCTHCQLQPGQNTFHTTGFGVESRLFNLLYIWRVSGTHWWACQIASFSKKKKAIKGWFASAERTLVRLPSGAFIGNLSASRKSGLKLCSGYLPLHIFTDCFAYFLSPTILQRYAGHYTTFPML